MLDQELKDEIAKDLPQDMRYRVISYVVQKGRMEFKDASWQK